MVDHAVETVANCSSVTGSPQRRVQLPTQQEFGTTGVFSCDEFASVCGIPIFVHDFEVESQIIPTLPAVPSKHQLKNNWRIQ